MTPTKVLTLEEYAQLPAPPDGKWEVHAGELVKVTFPRFEHKWIQKRLCALLEELLPSGYADRELPFCLSREPLELRGADVAWVDPKRLTAIRGYLQGSPDLVIEVLSPNNTATEIARRERLCLSHGARQFWVVDIELRSVRVATGDGRSITYEEGASIPLEAFEPGAPPLEVRQIFADLPPAG